MRGALGKGSGRWERNTYNSNVVEPNIRLEVAPRGGFGPGCSIWPGLRPISLSNLRIICTLGRGVA